VACQKKILYAVAKHNIFELAQSQTIRTQATLLVSSIFKQQKYIRMQAPAGNETNWIQQLMYQDASDIIVLEMIGYSMILT
jgi:hypothetical protein